MTQPLIQNFDVPANSDQEIVLTIVSSVVDDSLDGATIYWRAYEQTFGSATPDVPPVISKSSLSGGGIEILSSPPMTVRISILHGDVSSLLRNYYHEATIVDELGNEVPVTVGIMTVTATENRVP